MNALFAAMLVTAATPTVSPDVKATLDTWAESNESAIYPVAVIKFTNSSKKACTVKRYQLHWADGTYEGKPTDLKVEAGKTVEHRAKLTQYAKPADKTAVVQVWEADCK